MSDLSGEAVTATDAGLRQRVRRDSPRKDAPGSDRHRHGASRARRVARAAIVAAAILLAVVAGRVLGSAGGFAVLALSGILLLAVPTARSFSRRVLIALTIVFGVAPVLWWIPFPLPTLGRATFLLAVTAAGLGAWVAYGRDPRSRLRRLIPQMRLIDSLPLIVALMSAGTLINFLKARTASDAMTLLAMSWDNASHFDMYYMLRTHGQIIGALGNSPDGSAWHFYNYPQGFHSTVALLAELVRGPLTADLGGELVSYTILSAVAAIMAVTLVAAALCSLPLFRRSFSVAAPVVVFVSAGWIYGPGAAATMHGFQNFYVAVALVAAFLVLMVLQVRLFQPLTLVAAVAAAVGVAHNWVLLGTLLIGACAILVIPWNRRRWAGSRRNYLLAAGTAIFAILALLPALRQLSSISADDVLYAVGGVPAPDYGRAAAIVIGALGVSLLAGARSRNRDFTSTVRQTDRMAAGAWTVVAGLIVVVFMAVAQISKSGALSYYSIKYVLALELIALVVLAMGVVSLLGAAPAGRLRTSWRGILATLLLMAAVTQGFGLTLDTRSIGLTPSSTSALEFEKQQKALDAPVPRHVAALLTAVESNGGAPAAYLTTYGKEFDAILAYQWYEGLTRTYTEKSAALMPHLFPLWSGVEGLQPVVKALREAEPTLKIIVDPHDEELLRRILGDAR
ncbi:MAG: hypothetical protein JWN05_406 [Arthrobacter sp.]|jgi:hypothetical protein|nr:hypothetical protein [Arthrobacter sp.]